MKTKDILLIIVIFQTIFIINFIEFIIAAVNRKKLLSKKKLKSIFDMIDHDGNG